MWAPNDPRWYIPFGAFTALVIGLLIYLHLSDPTVGQPRHWTAPWPLYVCEGTPEWGASSIDEARRLGGEHLSMNAVIQTPCPLEKSGIVACQYDIDGHPYDTFCKEGAVVLTAAGKDYDWTQGDHSLYRTREDGSIAHATIEIPSDLNLPLVGPEGHTLPNDHHLIVVLHALLHAEGYDHTMTPICGPFVGEQSGSVMTRDIYRAGLGLEGL